MSSRTFLKLSCHSNTTDFFTVVSLSAALGISKVLLDLLLHSTLACSREKKWGCNWYYGLTFNNLISFSLMRVTIGTYNAMMSAIFWRKLLLTLSVSNLEEMKMLRGIFEKFGHNRQKKFSFTVSCKPSSIFYIIAVRF